MVGLKQTMSKSSVQSRRRSTASAAPRSRKQLNGRDVQLELARAPQRRTFSRVRELLHKYLPLRHPVVVNTSKWLSAANWLCSLRDGQRYRRRGRLIPDGPFFYIAICSSLADDAAARCLVHEWAHAMVWTKQYDRKIARAGGSGIEAQRVGHGPEWGIAYSQAYTAYSCDILPQLWREDAKREREKVRSASKRRSAPKSAAGRSSLKKIPRQQASSPTRSKRAFARSAGSSTPRRRRDRGPIEKQSQNAR